jgi:hypothetical protein
VHGPCARAAWRRGGQLAAASIVAVLAGSGTASGEVARSADDFVDSIGVNTHSYYETAAYANYAWRERLLSSGIRHIRENLHRGSATQVARVNDLYAAGGIRASFIFDPRKDRGGSVSELLRRLKGSMLAATAQVEGPNEYENADEPDWPAAPAKARAYQARLYARVKRDPVTAHLTVLGPSVAFPSGYRAWGDLSASLDEGNMHPYPGGRMPSVNLGHWVRAAKTTSGTKPVQATETGYHNALSTTNEHEPTSERAAAIYLPRTYLEYFRRGVKRTYAYELLDQGVDSSDPEDAFGLLREDYSDKPAMSALRNLIALLEDPGSGFEAGSLDYSLAASSSDVRHVLLQKRDGSFWLALWREVSVWSDFDREDLHPPAANVTLTLSDPIVRAAVYHPNRSKTASRTVYGPTSLRLDLRAAVSLVELITGTEVAASLQSLLREELDWLSLEPLSPRR